MEDRFLDDVGKWLDEGPPPQADRDIDDIANEPQRLFHGNIGWWKNDVPINEQCVRESPAAKARARARRLSRQYGWLFDAAREVRYVITSWFTTDIVLGLFRASYGIIMAVLLGVIIYCTLYASNRAIRTLPTIDELMKPVHASEEGSPQPQDGNR
jgi:hypothetical protein